MALANEATRSGQKLYSTVFAGHNKRPDLHWKGLRYRLVQCGAMTSNHYSRFSAGRSAARLIGLSAVVATLAICAYAGGQAKSGAPEKPAAITLNSIKAKATTGRAAKSGPSANIGQKIRLNGSGFDENVSVMFTGFADSTWLVRPLEVKPRRVVVTVPGQVVTAPVALSDPEGGKSNSLTLQIVPTIETLTPASVAPGARLLIDGSGFARDAKVIFKGVAQPVVPTVVSPTRIDVVVPAGAQTGKLTVMTGGGQSKAMRLTVGAAAPQ